jgi:hypothetical protein
MELTIPAPREDANVIGELAREVGKALGPGQVPVRIAVTHSDRTAFRCELGVLSGATDVAGAPPASIFDTRPRAGENVDQFNAVLLVPTGIGSEIGGHAGDAGPVARLLASACDTLVTHPNVVNASDINELPENGLYVEGSVISRLLMGTAALRKVRANRILLVMDEQSDPRLAHFTINAVSAARAAMGVACPRVVTMSNPIRTRAIYSASGRATGHIDGLERLVDVLQRYRAEYDAVALASTIEVPINMHADYFGSDGEMVNPWGGAEAMLTHAVSMLLNVPSAHAPVLESMEIMDMEVGVVEPRLAAEAVSTAFLHCVLKGLHQSPGIVTDPSHFASRGVLAAEDVACLVVPDRCVGLPTLAARDQGIPVIAVRENTNCMQNDLTALGFAPGKLFIVDNYLEAAGVMSALRAGVDIQAVRRPIPGTKIVVDSPANSQRDE